MRLHQISAIPVDLQMSSNIFKYISLLLNDYMIANPNLNENHSHLRQAFPDLFYSILFYSILFYHDVVMIKSWWSHDIVMIKSWCSHDREEKRRKRRTEKANANETYSHQGNFFFSTSSCVRINLFYTTIHSLYISIPTPM